MKNKIVYYALGAVALYYLYDWYKKKQPMQTPIAPGTNVLEAPVQQNTNLMPSSSVQNELAPGLSIVTDLISTPVETPNKEIPTYQSFYGETLNGVKVGKVPMTC
jgi:hypothetical protein